MADRLGRLAEEIKRELSSIIAKDMKDPRLGMISITDVNVSRDLSWAKVYYSQLGSEDERQQTLEGLNRARGFVRTELAKRLRVRHTPEIIFQFDPSLERGAKMDALFRSLHTAKEDGDQHEGNE
ncbi:MAG: 30S ribosome-binding factor RbfA [Firmicutes bacterium]|jgi:ribosome-binding factor A|nr:30S ribosome-binding factor RbfA [Bacillota bacterium]